MYGSDNHGFALRFAHAHGLANHFKGSLGSVRAHQKLGQEERLLFEAIPHKVQRGNHIFIDYIQGLFTC